MNVKLLAIDRTRSGVIVLMLDDATTRTNPR
jgi:hypothetical protein